MTKTDPSIIGDPGSPGSLGGDQWREVFIDRDVWQLSEDFIAAWMHSNRSFFAYLQRYTPAGGTILELGSGPGRHAICSARLGYHVRGIDIDPAIVAQASANARVLVPASSVAGSVEFQVGDLTDLPGLEARSAPDTIMHGGLMEHFDSADAIRESLTQQVAIAGHVVFDVPLGTDKNQALFARDDIFRQSWTTDYWLSAVLSGFEVLAWSEELHEHPSMTDDLVCVLGGRASVL